MRVYLVIDASLESRAWTVIAIDSRHAKNLVSRGILHPNAPAWCSWGDVDVSQLHARSIPDVGETGNAQAGVLLASAS